MNVHEIIEQFVQIKCIKLSSNSWTGNTAFFLYTVLYTSKYRYIFSLHYLMFYYKKTINNTLTVLFISLKKLTI